MSTFPARTGVAPQVPCDQDAWPSSSEVLGSSPRAGGPGFSLRTHRYTYPGRRDPSITCSQIISWAPTVVNDSSHSLHFESPHSFSCGNFQDLGKQESKSREPWTLSLGLGVTCCDTCKHISTHDCSKQRENCQISSSTLGARYCAGHRAPNKRAPVSPSGAHHPV